MRKLILSENLTLDGVMEAPEEWAFPLQTEDMVKANEKLMLSADALLVGRVTYKIFEEYWPVQTKNKITDYLNAVPKFVVSSTLKKAEWNNTTIIKDDIVKKIIKLKNEPGGNIVITGSAKLVQLLIKNNLIDEYNLYIYPVIRGNGIHLFKDDITTKKFKLIKTKSFRSGAVLLTYKPA